MANIVKVPKQSKNTSVLVPESVAVGGQLLSVERIDQFDYLIGENESGICGHSSRADVVPIRPT